MPALFYFLFWQQCLALLCFLAGAAFALLCLQLAVLFSVQTLLRVPAALRTEPGRLAPKVSGEPPLTCFHIFACGLRSHRQLRVYYVRWPALPRQLSTDAVRRSCGFWTAVPADAGVPTSRCDPLTGGVSSWPTQSSFVLITYEASTRHPGNSVALKPQPDRCIVQPILCKNQAARGPQPRGHEVRTGIGGLERSGSHI